MAAYDPNPAAVGAVNSSRSCNAYMKISTLIFLITLGGNALAQAGPEQGGTEIQVWTAGGHSVAGGRGSTGIWDAGLRYGWVLTDAHGPGFLKGRFEYALDAVPLYLIFQPTNTAYACLRISN